jgi:hypothetical protein
METQQDFADVEVDFNESARRRSFACWNPISQDNPFPAGLLKVVAVKVSNPESKLYVLTVKDEQGQETDLPMYPRDFQKVAAEWGAKPAQWQAVKLDKFGTRFRLVPVQVKPLEETI